MRIVRFEANDRVIRVGALTADGVVDLHAAAIAFGMSAERFSDIAAFLTAGESAVASANKILAQSLPSAITPLSQVTLRAPLPRPGKIIAVGLNYRDHSVEAGAKALPTTPILFAKFPTSICGPNDPILIPHANPQVDYEAELAVVIGRKGKAIRVADAFHYVFGFMPLNDVSARMWQFADKQWVRGKSCDTFCPIGPHLTTRDEISDPHALGICARVNGITLQHSHTSKMIFRIPELIEFVSESITLEPGDIIATGTPEGVGIFRTPPVLLKPGDVVEVEIENLGILRNPVGAA